MNTENKTQEKDTETTYAGQATYCPEDNKIRLYVGRVPRDEYLALREDGWTSTPKQSCDFVATWTPKRRDTALRYAGIIEDEDMGPEERAADRAERFGGYLEKRLDEAGSRADRYDAGPSVHGFQSMAKAVRAADRHDRIGNKAVDAWDKAEYWQRRTAGVISHALYVCSPSVRMGRIKELEAQLRRFEASPSHYPNWITHTKLRLAYENQMIEAQGGRLASVEIEAGGHIGGKLIVKVNKSTATGRVTSVDLKGPKVEGWVYRAQNVPGTDYALHKFDTERMPMNAYTPPTDESRAELVALKAEKKAKAPKSDPCPLINPTDEDAQRLLDTWNEWGNDAREASKKRQGWAEDFKPSQIVRMTQARYSELSGGTYSHIETRGIRRAGLRQSRSSNMYKGDAETKRAETYGAPIFKLRIAPSGNWHSPPSIIILSDKPQKPLPVAVWEKVESAELVNA